MRQSKKSKEVQSTVTAQEQFNIATKDLLFSFGQEFIKSNYELLILAWISSDNCDQFDKNQRSGIYYFNREFLNFLNEATSGNKEANFYSEFISDWDFKTVKKRLNEVYEGFLCTDESDDLKSRLDGILLHRELRNYLKKIFEIHKSLKSEMKLTA